MRRYGLIGYPLTHSFSKKYFEEKFSREGISGCAYELYPLASIKEFPALLSSQPELVGLNVTIPYKEAVIEYIDKLDMAAKAIGAVNCLRKKDGQWIGYNTDAYGFEISLKELLGGKKPDVAFVLGSGGASKAVIYVLQKLGIPQVLVSREKRNGSITYPDMASQLKASNLFINTTPLGMYPNVQDAPAIPYEKISANDFLFDLVYNPAETLFLQKGEAQGAKIMNGLQMLELQAEESWRIWKL